MSIVKNTPHYLKHSHSTFTTVLNKTLEIIENPATLGIYVYLASKPNDWEISITNLRNRFNKGGDFIRARLAELKRLGLMKSIATKNEKGQITHWDTVLYNEVQLTEKEAYLCKTQKGENPTSGEPTHVVDPHTTNKGFKEIKELNKKELLSNSATDVAQQKNDAVFDEFWNAYPIKKNKVRSKKIWDKNKYGNIVSFICSDVLKRINNDSQWQNKQFIPHPSTYLLNKLWQDDITEPEPNKTSSSRSSSWDKYLENSTNQGGNVYEHSPISQ